MNTDPDLGKDLYDLVPENDRPIWAAGILDLCGSQIELPPELEEVVKIGFDVDRWLEAHDAFGSVRKLTLNTKKLKDPQPRLLALLDIAETAAKVIYNASSGSAKFDYHAGWRMAPRLRVFSELIDSKEFIASAWEALIWPTKSSKPNRVVPADRNPRERGFRPLNNNR